MITMQQERPPFVQFDYKEYGQNREASERAGRPVPNVVPFAFITPAGGHGRDVFEKPAKEWLDQIHEQAINGRYNPDWVARFKLQYAEWEKGNTLPREGTPIKTWHGINKEQQIRLLAMGFLVVEDLAQTPDTDLGRIGLDGRVLRDLARNWTTGDDKLKQAKRIVDLEQSHRDQEETIKRLQEQLKDLEASLPRRKTG